MIILYFYRGVETALIGDSVACHFHAAGLNFVRYLQVFVRTGREEAREGAEKKKASGWKRMKRATVLSKITHVGGRVESHF